MQKNFEEKIVIVTGAAGGIGFAACQKFLSLGARVVRVDMDQQALENTAKQLGQYDGRAIEIVADMTVTNDVEKIVSTTVSTFGRIDCFFNNAGIEGVIQPITQYPEEMFDKVIAVNVKGVWLGLKYVGEVMLKQHSGVIVNTASTAGLGATVDMVAYGASKHAVVGMTKSAAVEWGPEGIRVNAVAPGPTETRMMRSIERQRNPDDPDDVHVQYAARSALKRYGDPEEIADLVVYLCSDEASYITGTIIPVDGGRRAN
tara:strand:+ start:5191 stop:5967 length:777 start_codon:yes stop_codon:yes gene_type:complete